MSNEDLKVAKIENGTVIDHIPGGKAPLILEILRIIGTDENNDTLLILVNVPSNLLGKKDIIKIENRKLTSEEIDVVSLIAPEAKVNIIEDFQVAKKCKVELPDEIEDIARCVNLNCITNKEGEPVTPKFSVIRNLEEDPKLRCKYCEMVIEIKRGVLNIEK